MDSNKASRLAIQSRAGDLATRSAILLLLTSTAASSVSTAAVQPPLREQISENQAEVLEFGAVLAATQVPLSRTGTVPHDLPFRFCIRRQQYQYGCPSLLLLNYVYIQT